MFDTNILKELEEALVSSKTLLGERPVLVGFDGYIDKLVRLKKNQKRPPEFFQTISEFSGLITSHSNQSCDIEVECISEKLGGNGPILADALAVKGVPVTCIGALGYPKVRSHFKQFAEHCTAISVEQPADTFAMEFYDGKLMFGDSGSLFNIDFALLCERVGFNRLCSLTDQCDLLCFTNWSGIFHSNDLLEGILSDIAPILSEKKRMMFFDLADPSPKEPEQFQQFFRLLNKMRKYFWVILGLNPNECRIVYNQFFCKEEASFSPDMLEELRIKFPCDEIVFHGIDSAGAGTKSTPMQEVQGDRIQRPKVVTGGGDNFNSGYCTGKLMGLSPALCACLGNLSSILYVADGIPPDLPRILDEIHDRLSK